MLTRKHNSRHDVYIYDAAARISELLASRRRATWCRTRSELLADVQEQARGVRAYAWVREYGRGLAWMRDLLPGDVRVLYIGIRRPGVCPLSQANLIRLDQLTVRTILALINLSYVFAKIPYPAQYSLYALHHNTVFSVRRSDAKSGYSDKLSDAKNI
jgi:hypothetical protein